MFNTDSQIKLYRSDLICECPQSILIGKEASLIQNRFCMINFGSWYKPSKKEDSYD
jgi:hypothetical protein